MSLVPLMSPFEFKVIYSKFWKTFLWIISLNPVLSLSKVTFKDQSIKKGFGSNRAIQKSNKPKTKMDLGPDH